MCSCAAAPAFAGDAVQTDYIPPPDIVIPTPDAVTPYVGYGISYDSNLLRLPSAASAQTMGIGSNLSDFTRSALFGLTVDKTFSQQHLTANLNAAKVNYDRFSQLDHIDKNAALNWNWHAGQQFQGNVGTSYTQGLTPFIDFHLLERNLRTTEKFYADGSWLLGPSWRLRGGLVHSKLWYDLASQQPGNNTQNQEELGLDYLASSGSTIGLQLRHIKADYPNPELNGTIAVLNGYSQDELKAKVDWLLTGKTTLHFLGGWVSRKQDEFSSRNFSGINTRVSADWLATGKIAVSVAGWREIGAIDDVSVVYSLNHGASIGSSWQYSEQIRLVAQYRYIERNFNQSSELGAAYPNDTLRDMALSLVYNPTRQWRIQLSGTRSTQTLQNAAGGYVSNGVMLTTRYTF